MAGNTTMGEERHLEFTTSEVTYAPSRHAREREAVRLSQQAFRQFHVECFWTFESDMEITITKVDWVIERLFAHGRGPAWKTAEQIQELLSS